MNRFELTTAASLKVGDRFYKATDKKKIPLVKVTLEPRKHFYCTASIYDLPKPVANLERNYKPISGDTLVIFLRHQEVIEI